MLGIPGAFMTLASKNDHLEDHLTITHSSNSFADRLNAKDTHLVSINRMLNV